MSAAARGRSAAALLMLVLVPAPTSGGRSASPDPSWWLREVNRQRLRASWHLAVSLALRNDRGFHRELELDVKWMAWGHLAGTLVVVTAPPALRGTAMLTREEDGPGIADRSWAFLNTSAPEVREVAGGFLSEGLLGSDFSHHDQQRLLDVSDWNLARLGSSRCGDADCERIAGTRRRQPASPLDPDRVIWWIDRQRKEIAKAELYRAGRLLKELEVTQWAAAGGLWIPRRQTMRTPELGSQTTLSLRSFAKVRSEPEASFRPESLPGQAHATAP